MLKKIKILFIIPLFELTKDKINVFTLKNKNKISTTLKIKDSI